MTLVKRLVTQLMSSSQPVQLGRWSIEYCPTIVETRVKLTNEDHCGTCGNMKPLHTKTSNSNTKYSKLYDEYIKNNRMNEFSLTDI